MSDEPPDLTQSKLELSMLSNIRGKATSPEIAARRRAIERRIGLDWFPVKHYAAPPSMRMVQVPLAVLYWLARGTQSYLGVHYTPLALGFGPPKTTEKNPPDPGVLAEALSTIEDGIEAEMTLDVLRESQEL